MTSIVFALISMISSSFNATVINEAVKEGGTVIVCNGLGADIETSSGLCVVGLSDDKLQAVDGRLASIGLYTSGCIHGTDGACVR